MIPNRLAVCLILVFAGSIANAAGQQPEQNDDISHQRIKLTERLDEARKKGVGTKPYESALLSIDTDAARGVPTDQLKKRLDSLLQSIQSQLSDMTALQLGAFSSNATAAETKRWGEYTPYMIAVQGKIKRHWNPPKLPTAQRMTVLFKVSKEGTVRSLKMVQSSGVVELDESILAAISAASPFAPISAFSKDKDLDLLFTFDYYPPRQRRH